MNNPKRIFLVDDETTILRPVKVNLERTGHYVVQTEKYPEKALETAREFQPDLIFLDMMMPGMDGGEIAQQLQAEPTLKKTPVVFLTAIVSQQETGSQMVVSGGRKFIAKPVNLNSLVECIEANTPKKI